MPCGSTSLFTTTPAPLRSLNAPRASPPPGPAFTPSVTATKSPRALAEAHELLARHAPACRRRRPPARRRRPSSPRRRRPSRRTSACTTAVAGTLTTSLRSGSTTVDVRRTCPGAGARRASGRSRARLMVRVAASTVGIDRGDGACIGARACAVDLSAHAASPCRRALREALLRQREVDEDRVDRLERRDRGARSSGTDRG